MTLSPLGDFLHGRVDLFLGGPDGFGDGGDHAAEEAPDLFLLFRFGCCLSRFALKKQKICAFVVALIYKVDFGYF